MSIEISQPNLITYPENAHSLEKLHGFAANTRVRLSKLIMASLFTISGLSIQEVVSPIPAYATGTTNIDFANDYPYGDANVYNISNFDWWIDENHNGIADVTDASHDNDETMSPYAYSYRNCTDGVAHWVKKYLGVDMSGFGNANNWDDEAGRRNLVVKPGNSNAIEPGDVAQSDDSSFGHVGFVTEVIKDGSGSILKVKVAELNKAGDGNFTHNIYASRNSNGNFIRSSSGRDWDHFIDINGSSAGTGGSRPAAPPAVPWAFETMEGDPNSMSRHDAETGMTPAAVEFNGQMYVFSYDRTYGDVRMARTSPGWQFEVLDGAGGAGGRVEANVGQTPTAVVYENVLHVFYYAADGGDLRHAWSADGLQWAAETLDGAGGDMGRLNANVGQTPTAVAYDGSLQLFYYDGEHGNLRHAWASSLQGWRFEMLEGDNSATSGYDSNVGLDPAAVVWGGQLQLFHYDEGGRRLRHAWIGANGWQFENLDGDPGSICGLSSDVGSNPAVTVHNGSLQVLYYDNSNHNLRHAWADAASGWRCETMEGDGGAALGYDSDVGATPTITSVGGSLQAFAYEPRWGTLRHYWFDGSGTHSENLDGLGGGPAGRSSTQLGLDPVVVPFGNSLQLFYYDQAYGNLRHAIPN